MEDTTYDILYEHLVKYNQEHLLKFWHELTNEQKYELQQDINELNLYELKQYFERASSSDLYTINNNNNNNNTLNNNNSNENDIRKLDGKLQPIPDEKIVQIAKTSDCKLNEYRNEGLKQISLGHVGILLMAGGQGTRLGFSQPKGMYDVNLPSHKTLYRLQAERIIKLQKLALEYTGNYDDGGEITWYIMTSEHTMESTLNYFKLNNYFGLKSNNVVIFEQGSLPCFEFNGKIILDQKHRISKAPDGNGGIYRALKIKGILDDIEKRNILYLHAHSVDNILIKVADPIFIGYCVQMDADCAAKVVEKSQPNEPVGVVCIVDGKYKVVEYSEISTKTTELRNKNNGRLIFNAGNICNHFFTTKFLKQISLNYELKLKLHIAKKKIPFIDNYGKRVQPDKPNGIKIEKFIFDVFEFAQKFVAMEVCRDEEFSALKNSDNIGKDCPITARNDLYRLHKKYIELAGGILYGDICEISPLLSYAGEDLHKLVNGKTFTAPLYLRSSQDALNNGHI